MIKLPVSTKQTQGDKSSDFDWIPEIGEIVYLSFMCDRDRNDLNNGCGCGRAFTGLSTGKSATTAVIAEVDISDEDLRKLVYDHFVAGDWIKPAKPEPTDDELVDETLIDMIEIGESFDTGTIVERAGDEVLERSVLV